MLGLVNNIDVLHTLSASLLKHTEKETHFYFSIISSLGMAALHY